MPISAGLDPQAISTSSSAKLSGADLYGANLARANLAGADLQRRQPRSTPSSPSDEFHRRQSWRRPHCTAPRPIRPWMRYDPGGGSEFHRRQSRRRTASCRRWPGSISTAPILSHLQDAAAGGRGWNGFCGAISRAPTLPDADLSYAELPQAKLGFAKAGECEKLSGALLAGADLSHADLTGADLTGADLTGADLYGAMLRGSSGLDQASGLDMRRRTGTRRSTDRFHGMLR